MERMERARATGPVHLAAAGLPKAAERERFDVYEAVTKRILERIESGVVPWQSPSIARVGYPRNLATRKHYRGINVFLLGSHEFQSPYFLTFLQAKELGGNVRKGEKGFPIVKVGTWTKEAEGSPAPASDGPPAAEPRKFLKLYTVFNACQIEGVEFPAIPKCETFTESALAANALHIEPAHGVDAAAVTVLANRQRTLREDVVRVVVAGNRERPVPFWVPDGEPLGYGR